MQLRIFGKKSRCAIESGEVADFRLIYIVHLRLADLQPCDVRSVVGFSEHLLLASIQEDSATSPKLHRSHQSKSHTETCPVYIEPYARNDHRVWLVPQILVDSICQAVASRETICGTKF